VALGQKLQPLELDGCRQQKQRSQQLAQQYPPHLTGAECFIIKAIEKDRKSLELVPTTSHDCGCIACGGGCNYGQVAATIVARTALVN